MSSKFTAVLGASENPARYSNMAIKKLTQYGHPVLAIGLKPGAVGIVPIYNEKKIETGIDTVTLYLNPQRQQAYYDYIIALKPNRIIFNPGAENDELAELAAANGIETMEACTLVMLATNQY